MSLCWPVAHLFKTFGNVVVDDECTPARGVVFRVGVRQGGLHLVRLDVSLKNPCLQAFSRPDGPDRGRVFHLGIRPLYRHDGPVPEIPPVVFPIDGSIDSRVRNRSLGTRVIPVQSFVLGKSVDEPLQGLNTAGLADEWMLEQFGGIPSLCDQHKEEFSFVRLP